MQIRYALRVRRGEERGERREEGEEEGEEGGEEGREGTNWFVMHLEFYSSTRVLPFSTTLLLFELAGMYTFSVLFCLLLEV